MSLHVAVVVGPTASGKTRLAVELAHRLGSEIVSADSRQVYVGLDLGTGKDLTEYAAVSPPIPYHLIDIVSPEQVYTLFDYQRDCYRVLRRFARSPRFADRRRPLLLVGGSGLYVEAVVRGFRLADVPPDHELRRRLAALPREALVAELERLDPGLAARTDTTSARRVVRALEVARSGTGARSEPLGVEVCFDVFSVEAEREWLRARIARRLRERLELGMVEEVERLLARGLPRARLDALGLEYRAIAAHLAGDTSRAEMVRRLEHEIGRFAKRQQTYFRGLPGRGVPVRPVAPGDVDAMLAAIDALPIAGC